MKKLQPITFFEKLSALIFIAMAFYSVFTDDWNFAIFALLLAFIAYMQVIIRWLCFIAELLYKQEVGQIKSAVITHHALPIKFNNSL